MTKRTFNPFRLEDLTGGINVRDYESEIEDKQMVDLINYNFSGNKLVSEKGSIDSGLTPTANIGALTIDSGDIWTVSAGDIKKNGTIVVGGVGILVTTSLSIFKPGVKFYITIEGIPYAINGDTVADFINNLRIAVEANGLITVKQDDVILIRKSNGLPVLYSTTVNTAYVIYNRDDLITTPYIYGKKYYWFVTVNGTEYSGIYTMSSAGLNMGQVDIEMMTQIYSAISGVDKQLIFLDSMFDKTDVYTSYQGILLNNVSSVSGASKKKIPSARVNKYIKPTRTFWITNTGIYINGTEIKGVYSYALEPLFRDETIPYSGSITVEGNTYTITAGSYWGGDISGAIKTWLEGLGYIAQVEYVGGYYQVNFARSDGAALSSAVTGTVTRNGTPTSAYVNISNENYTNLPIPDNLLRDRLIASMVAIPGFQAVESSQSGVLGIHITRTDLGDFTIEQKGVYTDPITIVSYDEFSSDIRGLKYEDAEVSVRALTIGTGLNGRSNMTIGNLGNLVVDKDVGGAYYAYEGIKVNIDENAIGHPTVGTIYNGKIVLGGFEGNDNIIFSKTSSPTQPLNVLNFSDYSSGGQSVSGGDKGLITGMMVGENGLYVFKDNSIWYTNSEKDDPTSNSFNFIFNKITSSGALTQNTITEVQQEIFYLDWKTRAVRRLGYEQNLTTLRDTAISDEIRPLLEALPEDQRLATSQFSYPNYMLSLSDHTGGTITYPNGKTFHRNNIHFIYNVDNKSWTKRTGIVALVSDKGYYVGSDGKVYKDFQGNTGEDSVLISKLYTFGDDVMYKKYGQLDIIGKTIGVKDVNVEIYIDGEKVDERTYNYNNSQIREKIDMYDVGQGIQWKITASGAGKIELYDIQVKWKPTTTQPQDYL